MPGNSNIPRKKGYAISVDGISYVEVVTVRRYPLGPRGPYSLPIKDTTPVSFRLKKKNKHDGRPKAIDVRELHVRAAKPLAKGSDEKTS